jgi:hypothetical protein
MRKVISFVVMAVFFSMPAFAQSRHSTEHKVVKIIIGAGAVAIGTAIAANSSESTTTTGPLGQSQTSTFSKSQLITGLAIAGVGAIVLWDGVRDHDDGPYTSIGVLTGRQPNGRQAKGIFVRRSW